MNYLDKNRKQLMKNYPDIKHYKAGFEVTENLLTELIDMGTKEKITYKPDQFEKVKSIIKLQIKALIARDLYDMSEYYQVINDENDSFKEALRIINEDNLYNKKLGKI